MKIRTIKEKLFYIVALGVSIVLLFYFIGSIWIGYDVKNECQNAKRQYGGYCVEALIAQLDDDHQNIRARNNAIWALGMIGDSYALPVLKKYYTGNIPSREPWDHTISQYELKKAIEKVKDNGGLDITAWLWRWDIK